MKSSPVGDLAQAIRNCTPKPGNAAGRDEKKNYAEKLSNEVARAVAFRLNQLGLKDCQPTENEGRERQFAGGIGAKKVDVSYATETGGLILGISIKSICFRDEKTKNFSKNLTNRRGDLLAESTTLHQRFPYAVLGAIFLFDEGADSDHTEKRISTLQRAHEIYRMFTDRTDRVNSVEKYEAVALGKFCAAEPCDCQLKLVGAGTPIQVDEFLLLLLQKVAERNPDHFRFNGKGIVPA